MSTEQEQVTKVVGRALRANYSPTFTNNELKSMGDAIYYLLEYVKNSPEHAATKYLLNAIGTEAKKNLSKLRSCWQSLTSDSLLMKTVSHPIAKIPKETTGELTRARRRVAAVVKKAKLGKLGDDIPF